ncbi:MAG: UTP--glucose-1-phosphate uridylyltransferase [Oscillospiraceae bacterium]|nr:UTP--glucose-1-phosphate uridylyltransferase [Oscillospiraceae bacterium]
MHKVKKAIIPAAGLGTRMLPASKSVPKEALAIVDKPAIQYIVEEAVNSGISDILIITNRGKTVIEDHFDRSPELEERLLKSGKQKLYDEMVGIANMANITFVRQKQTMGLGHAVLCAKPFVGSEPFAILYGDDVILGEKPASGQLCEAYEKHGLGVAGIREVTLEAIQKYSSMKTEHLSGNEYKISDMVEKPTPDKVFSMFSILGRCVLPPEIFTILENTPPGAGNEIQLTDAMKTLARSKGMIGVDFVGTRYDMGDKLGVLKAIVEVGLTHEEVGKDFKEYLKGIIE